MEPIKKQPSKTVHIFLIIICVFIAVLAIFQAGIFVGFRKAQFSSGLGNNYYRVFSHPPRNFAGEFFFNDATGGSGAVGNIVKINLPTFLVSTPDNIEKVIRIGSSTIIHRFRGTIMPSELSPGDYVIVLGSPNNQAEIEAKLIRLVPTTTQIKN